MSRAYRIGRFTSPKDSDRIFNFFFAALALTAFSIALFQWPSLVRRLFCPTQIIQTEADIVQSSLSILHGWPICVDFRKDLPMFYAKFSYPYFLLQALLMKVLGELWLPGRLIAFFSFLGSAALLAFRGMGRWKVSHAVALVALFLLSPTWAFWSTVTRVDTWVAFLNLCCLVLALQEFEEGDSAPQSEKDTLNKYGMTVWAGFFNALAILSKFTAGTTTLAVALAFLLKRKWNHLTVFLSCSAGLAALVMLFLQWESGGLYFLGMGAITQGYDFHAFWYYLTQSFLPEDGWLVAAVLLAWFWGSIPLLMKCQMAVSFLWLFSLGRVGGSDNYCLEPILFGILTIGESLNSQAGEKKKGMGLNNALVFKCALCALVLGGVFQMSRRPWPQAPSVEEQQMKMEAAQLFRIPGEDLAIDEDLLLMAGKRIWLQVHGYDEFVESGWQDPAPLIGAIRNRFFASIELYDLPRQPFLPGAVEDEIKKDYRVGIRRWGRVWLFPKPDPPRSRRGNRADRG